MCSEFKANHQLKGFIQNIHPCFEFFQTCTVSCLIIKILIKAWNGSILVINLKF